MKHETITCRVTAVTIDRFTQEYCEIKFSNGRRKEKRRKTRKNTTYCSAKCISKRTSPHILALQQIQEDIRQVYFYPIFISLQFSNISAYRFQISVWVPYAFFNTVEFIFLKSKASKKKLTYISIR